MSAQWYYLHNNVTLGPFTAAEIKERAARNLIQDSDPLWLAGAQPSAAPPTPTVRKPGSAKVPLAPLPDWLDDVAKAETKGPLPRPVLGNQLPPWLDELRLWYGLENYVVPKTTQLAPKQVTQISVRDRLEGLAEPAPPLHQAAKTMDAELFLADKAVRETGFDPRTGQVHDPHKFQSWQQATSASQPALTNEALFAAFRQARLDLEAWVADPGNQALVLSGDLDAIKHEVRVAEIFRACEGLAQVLHEKLLHHLELMVDEHRRCYRDA